MLMARRAMIETIMKWQSILMIPQATLATGIRSTMYTKNQMEWDRD